MATAVDPEGSGFVKSFAHPGANITGLTWDIATQMWGKYLEFLKEISPTLSRAALMWILIRESGRRALLKESQDTHDTLYVCM